MSLVALVDVRLQWELAAAMDTLRLLPSSGQSAAMPNSGTYPQQSLDMVEAWRIDPATRQLTYKWLLRAPAESPSLGAPDWEPLRSRPHDLPALNWRSVQGIVQVGNDQVLCRASSSLTVIDEAVRRTLFNALFLVLLVMACAGGAGWLLGKRVTRGFVRLGNAVRDLDESKPASRIDVSILGIEAAMVGKSINSSLERIHGDFMRQGRFATELAHELRTPLTAQRCVGELALRPSRSREELLQAVQTMLEDGYHMQSLIDSLLTLARAESGLIGTDRQVLDVREVVDACLLILTPLIEDKGQVLQTELGQSAWVEGELPLLQQALLNLIHNASEHCPSGSLIVVRLGGDVRWVQVSIQDDGPGMAVQEGGNLTSRRFRPRPGSRGLGLGLAIAKALVDSQGGRLTIDSTIGRGTTVSLRFLRAQPPSTSDIG